MIVILSCIVLLLSFFLTHSFCEMAKNTKLVNNPDSRTLHLNPTVRGGGLIFIGLTLCSLPFLSLITGTECTVWLGLLISLLLLAGISFMDDLSHLSVTLRLGVQCMVALIATYSYQPQYLDFVFFSIENEYVIFFFTFFTVIWSINHFNFMDGLDGFSALQAIFLLVCYFMLFNWVYATFYQDFCLVLAITLLGFLYYNFPPAKLFMGDVGSASLGLVVICLALIGQQQFQIPLLYWFMLNSIFLFDATLTLIRRVINKEQCYSPHKKHAYQRLKQYGLDTRLILTGQFLINIIIGGLLVLSIMGKLSLVLALSMLLLILIATYILAEQLYPMN